MGTIADKLSYLNNTKTSIKNAIISKGVNISDNDTFRDYADKINEIGETIEKTKFGATIDAFLGDVDADGNYVRPTGTFELNLSGVKSVPSNGLANVCYYSPLLTKVIGNEIVTVNDKSFSYAFYGCSSLESAEFNSIETIEDAPRAFESAFFVIPSTAIIRFLKLKKVASVAAFANAFKSSGITDFDKVFPVLEEISEKQAFQDYTTYKSGEIYTFSKVKKITGADQYGATFGGIYVQNTIWHFPSATEFTGYIWNVNASYTGEIHFAAANQAAIEACEGYDYKWGFTGATIYFDL